MMPDLNENTRVYEGMFLVDTAIAATWNDLTSELQAMITRRGGEIIGITRWDERKLAYPIKKHKRGTYVLAFFTLADGDQIAEIERDCRLSERVLRVLLTRADQFSVSDMRLQLGEDINDAVAQKVADARGEKEPREEADEVAVADDEAAPAEGETAS